MPPRWLGIVLRSTRHVLLLLLYVQATTIRFAFTMYRCKPRYGRAQPMKYPLVAYLTVSTAQITRCTLDRGYSDISLRWWFIMVYMQQPPVWTAPVSVSFRFMGCSALATSISGYRVGTSTPLMLGKSTLLIGILCGYNMTCPWEALRNSVCGSTEVTLHDR